MSEKDIIFMIFGIVYTSSEIGLLGYRAILSIIIIKLTFILTKN